MKVLVVDLRFKLRWCEMVFEFIFGFQYQFGVIGLII